MREVGYPHFFKRLSLLRIFSNLQQVLVTWTSDCLKIFPCFIWKRPIGFKRYTTRALEVLP
jgi:hypothetical protein